MDIVLFDIKIRRIDNLGVNFEGLRVSCTHYLI